MDRPDDSPRDPPAPERGRPGAPRSGRLRRLRLTAIFLGVGGRAITSNRFFVRECRIETRLPSFLPDRYVEDQNERMAIYKRLAHLESSEDADEFETEIADRFGELPIEAVNLIELTRIKLRAMHLGIGLVQFRQGRVVAEFLPGRAFHPHLCAQLVETFEGRVLFKAAGTFGLTLAMGPHADLLAEAKKLLQVAYFYDKTYNPPNREHPS